jgi:Tol biopolymer transport system component
MVMYKYDVMAYAKKIIIPILVLCLFLTACSIGSKKNNSEAVLLKDPHKREAHNLVWSPDGKFIALSYWSDSIDVSKQYSAIYVLDVTTKSYPLVIQDAIQSNAQSWSPNNEEFLFYSAGGKYSQGIWKVRRDGTTPPSFVADGIDSAWSQSGQIAILSMQNRDLTLSILIPGSKSSNTIYKNVGTGVGNASWSPDSTRLVFSIYNHENNGKTNLFFIDLKTNSLNQITTTGDNLISRWSSTSGLILYDKYVPGENEYSLFLTDSKRSCEIRIPGTAGADTPAWSPDGKSILFTDLSGKIYLLDLMKIFSVDFPTKGLVCPN